MAGGDMTVRSIVEHELANQAAASTPRQAMLKKGVYLTKVA